MCHPDVQPFAINAKRPKKLGCGVSTCTEHPKEHLAHCLEVQSWKIDERVYRPDAIQPSRINPRGIMGPEVEHSSGQQRKALHSLRAVIPNHTSKPRHGRDYHAAAEIPVHKE